jgi:hypothetical protein
MEEKTMQATAKIAPISKTATWTGYILTTLVVLFMLMDATMHVAKPSYVIESFIKLGFPASLSLTIAIIALISTVLYAIPRTAVLGAILLTAYLGGATAIQVRIDGSYWFSIVFGVLVWLALYLRDQKLRALIPLRS